MLWLVGSVVCLTEAKTLSSLSDQDLINPTRRCLSPANCTQLWALPEKQCLSFFQTPGCPRPGAKGTAPALSCQLRPLWGSRTDRTDCNNLEVGVAWSLENPEPEL